MIVDETVKKYEFQIEFHGDLGVVITKRPDDVPFIAFIKDELGTSRYNVVIVCGEQRK